MVIVNYRPSVKLGRDLDLRRKSGSLETLHLCHWRGEILVLAVAECILLLISEKACRADCSLFQRGSPQRYDSFHQLCGGSFVGVFLLYFIPERASSKYNDF